MDKPTKEDKTMKLVTTGNLDGTRTAVVVEEDNESFEILDELGRLLLRVNIFRIDGQHFDFDMIWNKSAKGTVLSWHEGRNILRQEIPSMVAVDVQF